MIWRTDLQRLRRELGSSGQSLGEGMAVRCLAAVDFYPPGGRLQVTVRELDPLFTLGMLARRRQETLAALAAAGRLERNRALPLPALPLRVGLVTSHDSAAFHDFLTCLRDSGYRFEVLLVHAAVQGAGAEREVASALATVAALGVDCAVLVRGGGSGSDLAAFDSRRIAEAIATLPVPVLTGLGHETDRSVADLVAHTALKTPTMVGEFLVRRVEESERKLGEVGRWLSEAARARLAAENEVLGGCRQRLLAAAGTVAAERARLVEAARLVAVFGAHRLARGRDRLERTGGALLAAAPRTLGGRRRQGAELAARLARAASGELRRAETALRRARPRHRPARPRAGAGARLQHHPPGWRRAPAAPAAGGGGRAAADHGGRWYVSSRVETAAAAEAEGER